MQAQALRTIGDVEQSSVRSEVLRFRYTPPLLEVVTGLEAQELRGGEVLLRWDTQSDARVTGYQLYRAPGAFLRKEEAEQVTSAPLEEGQYRDLPEEDGNYHYRVAAVGSGGLHGVLSEAVQARSDRTGPRVLHARYRSARTLGGSVGGSAWGTGPLVAGTAELELELSEALQLAPIVRVSPKGGGVLPVTLRRVGDRQYRGSFRIPLDTPLETARLLFSGRDRLGNRGSEVDSGEIVHIDAQGPQLISILLTPAAPIRVGADEASRRIAVEFTLSEAVTLGTTPDFKYGLSDTSQSSTLVNEGGVAQSVSSLEVVAGSDGLRWRGRIQLPEGVASSGVQWLNFSDYQAEDEWGNSSSRVTAQRVFEVYRGSALPALVAPRNLRGEGLPGGRVRLNWDEVAERRPTRCTVFRGRVEER